MKYHAAWIAGCAATLAAAAFLAVHFTRRAPESDGSARADLPPSAAIETTPPISTMPAPAPTDPPAAAGALSTPPVPKAGRRESADTNFPVQPEDRVAAARERAGDAVRELFAKAGVVYPAGKVFLRGFKREGEVELWAGGAMEPLRLVATYAVARHSGGPGPKRREGDLQVPEGFYEVDRFNPQSNFHLSLGINYPNAADRIHGDPERPGYDIFIHGSDVSVGCLAMGDDRIEEIYLAALDSRARPVRVHLFPARMDAADWLAWRDAALEERPELDALWRQLAEGFAEFERTRRVPQVAVQADGSYRISPQ